LSGIQLAALASLSRDTKDIPVILISGNVNREEIDSAMKLCNIRRYFEKPVDPEALINEVRSVFDPGETKCCPETRAH
jgi:response regulator RpfG family c-di-GMP phosphodiesterase